LTITFSGSNFKRRLRNILNLKVVQFSALHKRGLRQRF
jgi:hypothetical protein